MNLIISVDRRMLLLGMSHGKPRNRVRLKQTNFVVPRHGLERLGQVGVVLEDAEKRTARNCTFMAERVLLVLPVLRNT